MTYSITMAFVNGLLVLTVTLCFWICRGNMLTKYFRWPWWNTRHWSHMFYLLETNTV